MPILEKPVTNYDIAADQRAFDFVERMLSQRRAAHVLFDTLKENHPSSNSSRRAVQELLSERPAAFFKSEPARPSENTAQFTGNVVPFPKARFSALAKS